MNNNNTSQNNFRNHIYDNTNLSQIENKTFTSVANSNNVTISDQQLMPNVTSNNNYANYAISPDHNHRQYDASNNIPRHNCQQSMTNNSSLPQFYPQYINQNPPQSNTILTFNSLNITINSPQINIFIIPATNPDINIRLESFKN
ncbi:hypothetical protein C1646_762720 [Rhizophagus diaphanus]|nr:hypothetical protein C1646_762720 [Rhizophagus diaphanus] [Rhizophagus sp. MUCL 43196]